MKQAIAFYTLVQHTGFAIGGNSQFRQAVEEHLITDPKGVVRVRKAGGLLFSHYPHNETHAINYPPEVKGLIPNARGKFSRKTVSGLRIYILEHK